MGRGTAARWIHTILVGSACLAIGATPAMGGIFGKDKQAVPQWGLDAAKTKTPDYAKDAEAVVLFDEFVETIDDQGRATERRREAIRILKPQGRAGHTCAVGYDVDDKINYFRAWTIAADERQYQAQETDFFEKGDTDDSVMLSTQKERIARPPAIDVGAVIVCESEELAASYTQEKLWFFQDNVPEVFQALEVDLPAGHSYADAWHRHAAVKPTEVAPNHWRWEIKDEPALSLRGIPSAPEWLALAQRMTVQWGDAAVPGKDNQWRAIGQWVTKLEAGRPDPSPEITDYVQKLVAGAPDFYSKLSRITEAIQQHVRYFVVMRGIGGLQANHAADIFRSRYGDCKDKTTLLISMLQVVGIHGYYLAVDHRRGVVDPDDPSVFGDHMITAIEMPADVSDPRLMAVVKAKDGKRYLIFDPTNERTPVGNLSPSLQGGYGLLAAGSSSQVIALPVLAPDANGTEQKGSFTLTAAGVLSGAVDTSHAGPDGAFYRNFLKNSEEQGRRREWEKYVAHDVPGVVLNSFDFVQPAAFDKPLEFHYKITADQYAHPAGPLLLVRPRVVGSRVEPFNDKPRTLPIELDATGRWRDSFDIAIPDGYMVDDTPDPVNLDVDFAAYHSSVTAKGNKIHYEREYVVRQLEIPAEKAPVFRKLEGAILADEKGTVVLKKQ